MNCLQEVLEGTNLASFLKTIFNTLLIFALNAVLT